MPEPILPSKLIAEVQISSRAVMMKLGDTLPLSVNAIAMDESTLPVIVSEVRWRSLDSVQVYVDTLGRLVGRRHTTLPVSVIASYQLGPTTKADTIPVWVTTTSVQATRVKLVVLDSSRVGARAILGLPRVRTDLYRGDTLVTGGAFVPITVPAPVTVIYAPVGGVTGEPVYLVSNEKSFLGTFWVRASVNLYGNDVRDSVEFTGVYPASIDIYSYLDLAVDGSIIPSVFNVLPPSFTLQPCGIISIVLYSPRSVDVVFSDSMSPADGCAEIPSATLTALAAKKFNPLYGDFIGTNVTGFSNMTVAFRRSSTVGRISYYLRESATKERIAYAGEFFSTHYNP